jgi:hypothetical protein
VSGTKFELKHRSYTGEVFIYNKNGAYLGYFSNLAVPMADPAKSTAEHIFFGKISKDNLNIKGVFVGSVPQSHGVFIAKRKPRGIQYPSFEDSPRVIPVPIIHEQTPITKDDNFVLAYGGS